jgi:endoglucanase
MLQPVIKHQQLKVAGTRLVDINDQPVILRGMSFGWHNWWPRFYNAGTVQWLHKDWGCTIVRAAMGVEPDGGYLKDPVGSMEKIKAVVDAAIKEGIYVIIDWHSHNIHQPEAVAFFKEMAALYGQYPHVIYEIFNEPEYQSWQDVKKYAAAVIEAIREIDPHNIILTGSPHWDQYLHLAAADPITGYNNLMYTMHFYAASHKQLLRDRTDAAIKQGLPIFVSECAGMEATGDGPIDDEEWQRWIDWMEARGLSWLTWSVADKDETCSVLKPIAASDGNWSITDLKESGIKIRGYLRKYNLEK